MFDVSYDVSLLLVRRSNSGTAPDTASALITKREARIQKNFSIQILLHIN